MSNQIECVGGPFDGKRAPKGDWVSIPDWSHLDGKEPDEYTPPDRHIYHYDPSSNKYVYKGVEK